MEKEAGSTSGLFAILIQFALLVFAGYVIYDKWAEIAQVSTWVIPAICIIAILIMFAGYVVLNPNEASVLSFMGKYKGTLKTNGLNFVNPFYSSSIQSLKVSNYAMTPIKVNDMDGVPIEIAATIVWSIGNTYKAEYDVDDLSEYIDNQFEISLRELAKNHTYSQLSTEEKDFIQDLTSKCSKAGVLILDAKITHLNYVPEIAAVMLQKQQANAMSEAKEIIVNTAVHIAQNAARQITDMTEPQKAMFISNLIVVLCSERGVAPVLNVTN